ncbi:MAG TPA: DNA repair protein RecO [Candidatus Baltobacteraceae bacterium]|jgi:DNA repair protein RecO (recombination protein O)|nr:DNA repair protein RecO [Candidatus Baltobacteraceae bacterium]
MSERGYRGRTSKARAYLLRARQLGEADRILTLFTRERGKIDAVAKGARRPKSVLAGCLEFGSELDLGFHHGRSLDVVVSADVRRLGWSGIVRPEAFATGQLFAELVDLFCEPELAQPEIYTLLDRGMQAVASDPSPGRLVARFELRLLIALGLAPVTDGCVRCGETFVDRPAWADLEAGGLACVYCRPHRADGLALDAADTANMRGLAAASFELGALLESTSTTGRVIDAFISYHLGKRPKSLRHLDEVRTLNERSEAG